MFKDEDLFVIVSCLYFSRIKGLCLYILLRGFPGACGETYEYVGVTPTCLLPFYCPNDIAKFTHRHQKDIKKKSKNLFIASCVLGFGAGIYNCPGAKCPVMECLLYLMVRVTLHNIF